MKVLVTGGAGYIGSHTCIQLIKHGHTPVVIDNLCNSKAVVLDRIECVTGTRPAFMQGDVRDSRFLKRVFATHAVDSVIHFAGLKAVGESVEKPLKYYDTNVSGTLNLVREMQAAHINSLIFSSSATVYGEPASVPIQEDFPTAATNPYGRSKLMAEECLRDFQHANPDWSITLLRYFNPVGAHDSGLLGEDPQGTPNNLLPYVAQVAVGRREKLGVFGNDYPTPDGTGVRDYIHVVDLADGHLAALDKLAYQAGIHVFNLGTGQGHSVLDMLHAFETVAKRPIPYEIKPRRAGDIAECYADPACAKATLGWSAKKDLQTMVEDTWRWQSKNPNGYGG